MTLAIYCGMKAEAENAHKAKRRCNSDVDAALVNILQERFNPEEPDRVWCSDITYIWTTEGFVYLESIMDLFSRKIIAWNLSRNLDVAGIIKILQEAKQHRNPSQLLSILTAVANTFRRHT